MSNFGETLTYWYLRLNGFFPMANFVLHKNKTNQYSADSDLLAIRFKHVYEEVGGQNDDWDEWFQAQGLEFSYVTALIVEVKTGETNSNSIQRSFSAKRLEYAVQRFGFYRDPSTVARSVSKLEKQAIVRSKRYQIAKLLVTANTIDLVNYPPCLHITLSNIEKFIDQRMIKYSSRKSRDRFFFPDDLIQYFAWKNRD